MCWATRWTHALGPQRTPGYVRTRTKDFLAPRCTPPTQPLADHSTRPRGNGPSWTFSVRSENAAVPCDDLKLICIEAWRCNIFIDAGLSRMPTSRVYISQIEGNSPVKVYQFRTGIRRARTENFVLLFNCLGCPSGAQKFMGKRIWKRWFQALRGMDNF